MNQKNGSRPEVHLMQGRPEISGEPRIQECPTSQITEYLAKKEKMGMVPKQLYNKGGNITVIVFEH